jgi:hypothetical protein
VQYWPLVTKSFGIAWRHKYLWLVALFAGEGGGGGSFNSSTSNPGGGIPTNRSTGQPDFSAGYASATSWLNAHVGVIAFAAVLVVLVWIVFFILAAVCEGATIRGAAEHDAERPFGLGWAWRAGRQSMGTVIRIRLLLLALGLPVALVLLLILAGFIASLVAGNGGAAVALGLLGGLLGVASIVYFIYLDLLSRLSLRAAVLEQVVSARQALGRGHGLVFKRFGRVILVWLLALGVGIGVGIVLAIALLAVAVPLLIAGFAAAAAGSAAVAILIAISALILVPVLLVASGFLAAQNSTYWTLAFRRLEIDAPALAYSNPPPPQGAPARADLDRRGPV